MNFAGIWGRGFVAVLLMVAGALFPAAAREPGVPSLSFDLTAQIAPVSRPRAPHNVKARVYLRGQSMRVETRLGSQQTILLLAAPYSYRLLPETKTGVRYKSSVLLPEVEDFAFGWREMLSSPQQIRRLLHRNGAKKVGAATVNGTQTEIYTANRWNGRPLKIKLWLRHNDALPVRMESTEDGIKAIIQWKNYRRGAVASSLMVVPKGYHIRDGRPPRRLWP